MGLDIEAGRRARRVGDDEDRETLIHFFPSPHGPFAARADGLAEGVYEVEDRYRFRAGSYSGYGEWREALCRFAFNVDPVDLWDNRDHYAGKPFYEVIDFSDCEGGFGAETSANLARDFAEWDDGIRKVWGEESWEYRVYSEFRKAFNRAADAGVLQFA